jgi:integrating conjugative element protein (TIGR03756 family)
MLNAAALGMPELSTKDIIRAAADKDCLDYKVRGVCFWLDCGPLGCQIRSSEYVSHYLPDAVVMVYAQEPAWSATRTLHQGFGKALSLGGAGWSLGTHGPRYYSASVIGSPALEVMRNFGVLPLCSSAAQAMEPYFLSDADSLSWRFALNITETPKAQRMVGRGSEIWGPLMPRNGFIVQAHATKAASVIAQRAADIVVHRGQKHVYRHMKDECGLGCFGPPALKENSAVGGKWQRLHPSAASCEVFASEDSQTDYADGWESYAWHLWRPYHCCRSVGQKLLKIVEIASH